MAMQHPQFDPVALSLGPFAIHWYGLMYLLSFLVGWAAAVYRTRLPHVHWTKDDISDFLFYVVLGVVLGGRIGYMLFYHPDILLSDPLELFYIWNGGMSFHGGMLGVFIGCWWYGRKSDRTFFDVTDFVAPVIPIGLFFGRIANFINAELVGRVTDVPWAMVYPQIDNLPRHPSQLYQAGLEGPVFLALLWWFARKSRPRMAVSGVFLLGYGCLRFFSEFFRLPDAHLGFIAFDWMTMGQALCLPMIAGGLLLLWLAYGRSSTTAEHGA
jgi:phosphatidylglycerol:prolipoprotein diacylglycerol transferase